MVMITIGNAVLLFDAGLMGIASTFYNRPRTLGTFENRRSRFSVPASALGPQEPEAPASQLGRRTCVNSPNADGVRTLRLVRSEGGPSERGIGHISSHL
jgi:hypothetical protein